MHVVELKRNPESGEDFMEEDAVGDKMPQILREEGILARAGASISVAPPLIINGEEVDALVDSIDRAIGRLESELSLALQQRLLTHARRI